MTDAAIVYVTTGSEDEAQRIAEALIDERLAACVQSHPITSTYRWKGETVSEGEVMLTLKTRAALFPAIERAILAHHSYEVPEIVMVPVADGHRPYLDWIREETTET